MKKVFDEVVWYALGRKGNVHRPKHGCPKENKNVTRVQDFLSTLPEDNGYHIRFKSLVNSGRD